MGILVDASMQATFLGDFSVVFQKKFFNREKTLLFIYLFKIIFVHFPESGEGKEKEGERNMDHLLPLTRPQPGTWPAAQACAPTENWTGDLSVCRPVPNPLSHISQGSNSSSPFWYNSCYITPPCTAARRCYLGLVRTCSGGIKEAYICLTHRISRCFKRVTFFTSKRDPLG